MRLRDQVQKVSYLMGMMERMHQEKVEKGSDVTIEFSTGPLYVAPLLNHASMVQDAIDPRYVWRVEYCAVCAEHDAHASYHFFLTERKETV